MLNWTATAAMTFVVTNIDDLLILVLLFSQVGVAFGRRHVIAGQTLGFAALVAVSLTLGLAGGLLIPARWLALLGLVPLALGVRAWLDRDEDGTPGALIMPAAGRATLAVPALQVAALTVANGGDNLGVYVPLLARADPAERLVTLAVFGMMLAIWLVFGFRLTRRPAVAARIGHYGRLLMPPALILLGLLTIVEGLALA
jgi:cadmium resistance protein CadD (predicted permease)